LLCHAEEQWPLRTLDEHNRMQRADMFMRIENRLMVILQVTTSISDNQWSATRVVWRTTALTTLIFVHHFLRGSPLRYRHFGVLVPQLHQALSAVKGSFRELAFARSLLFWVLSVGAVTSSAMDCHTWFIHRLAEISAMYSMGWHELRSLLKGFLWAGDADEQRYLEVWRSVERAHAA